MLHASWGHIPDPTLDVSTSIELLVWVDFKGWFITFTEVVSSLTYTQIMFQGASPVNLIPLRHGVPFG